MSTTQLVCPCQPLASLLIGPLEYCRVCRVNRMILFLRPPKLLLGCSLKLLEEFGSLVPLVNHEVGSYLHTTHEQNQLNDLLEYLYLKTLNPTGRRTPVGFRLTCAWSCSASALLEAGTTLLAIAVGSPLLSLEVFALQSGAGEPNRTSAHVSQLSAPPLQRKQAQQRIVVRRSYNTFLWPHSTKHQSKRVPQQ